MLQSVLKSRTPQEALGTTWHVLWAGGGWNGRAWEHDARVSCLQGRWVMTVLWRLRVPCRVEARGELGRAGGPDWLSTCFPGVLAFFSRVGAAPLQASGQAPGSPLLPTPCTAQHRHRLGPGLLNKAREGRAAEPAPGTWQTALCRNRVWVVAAGLGMTRAKLGACHVKRAHALDGGRAPKTVMGNGPATTAKA